VSGSVYMAAYQKDLYLVRVEADGSGRGGEIFLKRLSEVFFLGMLNNQMILRTKRCVNYCKR
jgi:hypothetical protein